MSVIGASPYVQNAFNDQPGYGYPGQLANQNQFYLNSIIGYSTEDQIFCGRAVAIATIQNFTTNNVQNTQPFTIRTVEVGDVAADLVGVCFRPFVGTQTYQDTDNAYKAGFGAKTDAPILPFGSKQIILVRQAPGVGNINNGDPVYVALSATNDYGLLVGEFGNAADEEGDNMLLVPNAKWVYKKNTSTSSDQINAIQLN